MADKALDETIYALTIAVENLTSKIGDLQEDLVNHRREVGGLAAETHTLASIMEEEQQRREK